MEGLNFHEESCRIGKYHLQQELRRMFRELVRKKQQLSNAECIEILKNEMRGVLSVQGDDGYPYGLPIDHWYNGENGKLYFHSGKTGHKIDALKRCDKVSFCAYDPGVRNDGEWALNIKSVVAFGRVKLIEEQETVVDICRKLSLKYTQDIAYIEEEIRKYAAGTVLLEMTIEHLTGKIVNEA